MSNYYIYMNQALVVDLRHHQLSSGEFSSCAPIVLYNSNTHQCGLYHLGGCDKLDKMRMEPLFTLIDLICPVPEDITDTVAYVLKGAGTLDGGLGLQVKPVLSGHVVPVTQLFESIEITTHYNFNGTSAYPGIMVSEVNGELNISQKYDNIDKQLKTRAEIDALPDEVKFIGDKDDEKLKIWG